MSELRILFSRWSVKLSDEMALPIQSRGSLSCFRANLRRYWLLKQSSRAGGVWCCGRQSAGLTKRDAIDAGNGFNLGRSILKLHAAQSLRVSMEFHYQTLSHH